MAVGVASRQNGGYPLDISTAFSEKRLPIKKGLDAYFDVVEDESDYPGRRYHSYFEAVVADALKKSGIEFRHETWSRWIRRIKEDPYFKCDDYVPDFFTRFTVNGKILLIEPHGSESFTKEAYEKFARFLKERGEEFYFIIITDLRPETLSYNLKTREKDGVDRIADEVWCIPSYKNQHRGEKKYSEPTKEDVDVILEKLKELRLRTLYRGND